MEFSPLYQKVHFFFKWLEWKQIYGFEPELGLEVINLAVRCSAEDLPCSSSYTLKYSTAGLLQRLLVSLQQSLHGVSHSSRGILTFPHLQDPEFSCINRQQYHAEKFWQVIIFDNLRQGIISMRYWDLMKPAMKTTKFHLFWPIIGGIKSRGLALYSCHHFLLLSPHLHLGRVEVA